MKSRYLVNLFLVMLVIGLYWLNSQPDPNAISKYAILSDINTDSVNTIKITRPNSQTIVINKQGNGWQLLQPINAKANDTRIQLILSILSTPSYAQLTISNQPELSRFGITDTTTTLMLNDQVFQFGTTESLSKHRYVLFKNNVHLIDDQVTPLLNANVASFIENRLLGSDKTIKQLTLPLLTADNQFVANNIKIEQADGHWQTKDSSLSADALTGIISSWQHAYATQVFPLNDDIDTTTSEHDVMIVFENDPDPLHLMVKLKDNTLFIIDSDAQLKYQFPVSLSNQLFPSQVTSE